MPRQKPKPLTVTETEVWPTGDDKQAKLGIAFEGGDIELLIDRMEAAKLVGALRSHFGL